MPKIHDLKCLSVHFEKLCEGTKTFEIRKNDRGFKVGDYLHLLEYSKKGNSFSGWAIWFEITDVFFDPEMVKAGYVILSLKEYKPEVPKVPLLLPEKT